MLLKVSMMDHQKCLHSNTTGIKDKMLRVSLRMSSCKVGEKWTLMLQMDKFGIHSRISTGIKMVTSIMKNFLLSIIKPEMIWREKDMEEIDMEETEGETETTAQKSHHSNTSGVK